MDKVVIIPDSFKGTLSSKEVAALMGEAVGSVFPEADRILLPIGDGGEGTVESFLTSLGGERVETTVCGPFFTPVSSFYGRLPDGTVVIEMAAAAGLPLVGNRREVEQTTTFGVGELMGKALEEGAKHIILGLGGSATNDGGAGMLQALGAHLYDANGHELPRGGAALARLHHADFSGLHPALANTTLEIACDVTNPLCGANGASAIFGPQKGADAAAVAELDAALAHYAAVLTASGLPDQREQPGAGAAGGLGYALALLGANLTSGIDLVMQAAGVDAALANADLVITGEGRLDGQTRLGKVPLGVLRLAQQHGVPVIAIAGVLGAGAETLTDEGFTAIFPSIAALAPLDKTLAQGGENLERTARQIAAVLALGGQI